MLDKKFRVIVAGGRKFNNYKLLKNKLDIIFRNKDDIQIVCGKAPGADTLGEKYAKEKGYSVAEFPAKWRDLNTPGAVIRYRKDGTPYNAKAGHDRNLLMSQNADAAVIFWDGKSTGSKDMIDLANNAKLLVRVINY